MIIKKNFKNKIISTLIVSLILSTPCYAGMWVDGAIGRQYVDDNGKLVAGWRWLDVNNDGIMECYRFSQQGILLINSVDTNNKETNINGQWVVNGVVQQIYASNKKPLSTNMVLEVPKAEKSTSSVINAAGYDVFDVIKEIKNTSGEKFTLAKSSSSKKTTTNKGTSSRKGGDPRAVFSPSNAGYILGTNVKIKTKVAPTAVFENEGNVLDTTKEDEVKYLEAGETLIAGKDMATMVTSSNKFTKSVKNVRIWGGEVWEEAMQLSGNGASVKFNLSKPVGEPYNWFRMEIAHQTHGESTADTNVVIELYMGGQLVTSYDAFNDDVPEVIEEWCDDEKTIELKVVITGDAKGRKVYIRNAKARTIKEKEET